jgi:hypothetical protein
VRLDPVTVSVKFALDLKPGNSPETPARVRRLATPLAAVNLTVQALDAVVVAQVETLVGVLVLDFELRLEVAGKSGRGTHALCLAGRKVASEHAAIASAGVVDPCLGLVVVQTPALGEALSHRNFCVDGSDHSESDSGGDLHGGSCDRESVLWYFAKCLEIEVV